MTAKTKTPLKEPSLKESELTSETPLMQPPDTENLPPISVDELQAGDLQAGPTLNDAAISGIPTPETPVPNAPPMTPEQIIGVVAEMSAFGLPTGVAEAYKEDYKNNPMIQLGVQMSGLTEALAAYGVTAGGGKLPDWLSVALGVTVLGYGVYTTRNKYAPFQSVSTSAEQTEENPVDGFSSAGLGTPIQTTNIGFGNASNTGGNSVAPS